MSNSNRNLIRTPIELIFHSLCSKETSTNHFSVSSEANKFQLQNLPKYGCFRRVLLFNVFVSQGLISIITLQIYILFPAEFSVRRRGDVRMYSVEMCLTALVWEVTWIEISMSSLTAHWACHHIKYIRQWIRRIYVQLFSRPLQYYRFGFGFWAFRRFKLECVSSSNTMI